MTAILPNLSPGDTCDPGRQTETTAVRQPGSARRGYDPTRPSTVWTARLNRPPAATCVALARPVTCTGPEGSVVVPLPSWPEPLNPQAQTVPSDRRATPWPLPAAT